MSPTRFRVFVSSVQRELARERKELGAFLRNDALLRRFFDVFRVRLLLGGFSDADYRSSLTEVMPIIISHRVWETQFGSDPNVIGRTTPTMYSRTYQIVGVMAEDGFVPPLPGSNSAAARRANRVDVLMPPFVEALGVAEACILGAEFGCRMHIHHLSSGQGLRTTVALRAGLGTRVTVETCPQYLFLTDQDVRTLRGVVRALAEGRKRRR